MHSQRWTIWRLCAALSATLALSACGGGDGSADTQTVGARSEASGAASHDATADHFFGGIQKFVIRTLGNRADLISNGDALVEVQVPAKVPLDKVKVTLNGKNISSAFKVADASKRTLRGVVTGLRSGHNLLRVDATTRGSDLWGFLHGYDDDASLIITNHARGGPILLGSQTTPWICATPTAVPASGDTPASNASGLSTTAVDAQCNIATETKLFYRTTATICSTALPDPSPPAVPSPTNCFKPYTTGVTPADLATTTTTTGLTVPYIVRVERGTLNRGIYDIAVLFDPTQPWTATSPQPQWNGKVVHSFGASTGHTRLQTRTSQNWADQQALSRGFMVIDNSLTDSLHNSNRVLVAETVMMMKEHITDTYGEIKYVVGNGCSGGSIQQNTVSSIFPGLLDGIQPACTYPDSITTGMEVGDCVLLVNLYDSPEWKALMQSQGLTQAQINAKKTAINGHLDHLGCQSWNNAFGFANEPGNFVRKLVLDQATGAMGVLPGETPRNNCLLPAALVYDPVSNPTGTRCSDPDNAAAVWGTTHNELAPTGKRALQTGDNTGIQYGLGALKSGAISAEEFVLLNEKIGGTDNDAKRRAQRTTADLAALPTAYRAGIVSSGANLGKVPIIDSRGYDEQGIHFAWRAYSERARIAEANGGNHGNQVIWRYGTALIPITAPQVAAVTVQSFLTLDTWLSTLLTSAPKDWINDVRTQAQVIAAKPAAALDLCFLANDPNFTTPITDMALCDDPVAQPRLQKHASPRQVAGGSLAENILKCQLKAINTADYLPATFTAEQLNRLYDTFPGGVCDWSKPGVGQQPARSPLTFANGPGGKPLPRPPGSGLFH
ncbi:MAG TPA: DUF6351 family protein [Burkholderiaceae bacterium]